MLFHLSLLLNEATETAANLLLDKDDIRPLPDSVLSNLQQPQGGVQHNVFGAAINV